MKKLLLLFLSVSALLIASPPGSVQAATFEKGDVFVGIQGGIRQYRSIANTFTLVDTIQTTGAYNTGMAFDKLGNLFSTQFDANSIYKINKNSNVGTLFASGITDLPESLVFDKTGSYLYSGRANGLKQINKYDPFNVPPNDPLLQSYTPTKFGNKGTDWIDLAHDQTTIYYTSEGSTIYRFDTNANGGIGANIADFANNGTGNEMFALRILANGSVIVADSNDVLYFNADGSIKKTYLINQHTGDLFALNFDPDGTSFWTAELGGSGNVYKVDIASGTILETIETNNQSVAGLAIYGEVTPNTVPEPSTFILMGAGIAGAALLRKRSNKAKP